MENQDNPDVEPRHDLSTPIQWSPSIQHAGPIQLKLVLDICLLKVDQLHQLLGRDQVDYRYPLALVYSRDLRETLETTPKCA